MAQRDVGATIAPSGGNRPAAPGEAETPEPTTTESARAQLEQAASGGDVDAMVKLGLLLYQGDAEAAREWWGTAASLGDPCAMFNLGVLLQPTDADAAWRWWDRAATAGHVEAMNLLGSALRSSYPDVARPLLEKAAVAGHAGAMNHLGLLLLARGDNAGLQWLKDGSAHGDTGAQSSLRAVRELGVMGALEALSRGADAELQDTLANLCPSASPGQAGSDSSDGGSIEEPACDFELPVPSPAPASLSATVMSVQPELWVDPACAAVAFYEAAFGASVSHKIGGGNDTVAELRLGEAAFWISAPSPSMKRVSPKATGGTTSRIRLVVDDPEPVIAQAVAAGAKQTSAVVDDRGWRHGRIVDPFGHEWEICRPLGDWPPVKQPPR